MFRSTMKKGTVALLLVASLAGGAAAALAQEVPPTDSAMTQDAPRPDRDRARFKGPGIEAIMEILDVEKGDIISTFASGGTLADLAEENGSSGEALVNELVAMVGERLDEAVANGVISEERAAEILANAEEKITNFVFSTHQPPGKRHNPGTRLQGVLFQTVLDFLDVSKGDVVSNFATGGTLADLAEENGSSGDALVDALVAVVAERVDEAVANGAIDEARAAEILANAEERITTFVNTPHQPGRGQGNGNQAV